MADMRTRIRRTIEILGLYGAAASCFVTGKFGLMVADASPVVIAAVPVKLLPLMTSYALAWKQHLPTIGLGLAIAIVVASLVLFVVSKNEDTRLQVAFGICIMGYGAAIMMWSFVGMSLVALPHLAHVI